MTKRTYQPKKTKRRRTIGFMKRNRSAKGRKLLKRRNFKRRRK